MSETQLEKELIENANGTQPKTNSVVGTSVVATASPAPRATLRALRDRTEIYAISQALEESGWNRKRAAKLLSISYRGLLHKIRQHNITPSLVSSLTQMSRQDF
jgi:two-component system, NtrC family, response regulator AtoC